MKILIINGSHRKGNTDILIERIFKGLQTKGAEIREIILRDIHMKLPDGCVSCADSLPCPHVSDQFSEEIEPSIRDYDAYIIATPTWSDGVTPLTKIFWDRIVSWCHDDRKYLKGKKLALITHGMADESSWNHVISWARSVCGWEEAIYGGSLTCKSGGKIGEIEIIDDAVDEFVAKLIN